jgi:hypothetical protein
MVRVISSSLVCVEPNLTSFSLYRHPNRQLSSPTRVYNEVFKQWLKERIPKEGKQGPREEKQIEYGWEKKKSVTKFKFFFSFPRVIIPPLPLHIFKTHSLLLCTIVNMDVCVYNEVFKQWLKERIPKEGKQGPREESDLFFSLQASESATVISNTGNVRLILDFGFPQWMKRWPVP